MSCSTRDIRYLSDPETVSMGDDWFQYANADHFWMKRRFEVFQRLAAAESHQQTAWAEVGCGHGVVQHQIETELDLAVDGMDLNEFALQQNRATRGSLLCYNVFDRSESVREAYDRVILFDVIEHMDDDAAFVDAVLHLVKPGGVVFVNVPAFMHLFSRYDIAAGHVRRYDHVALRKLAHDLGLTMQQWTYWGAPLVPLLYARKLMLGIRKTDDVIKQGFAVESPALNSTLFYWSRLEWIPQRLYGTSLMACWTKPK